MAKTTKNQGSPGGEETTGSITRLIHEGLDELVGCPGFETLNHVPKVDMFSTSGELVIEVELPGVRTEEIDLSLFKNTIIIKALKYECFDEENLNYVCMERTFGRIYRTIEIPFPVDTGKARATCSSGILTIVLPRVEDRRLAVKHIPVEPL